MGETWLIELTHDKTPIEDTLTQITLSGKETSDDLVTIDDVQTDWVWAEPITATVILISIGTGKRKGSHLK